jgi:hypothetical protein
MEEAYKIAKRVSFITPARFLFNAGQTPKKWNKKMLEDEHLKIEFYERDSSKVFANTDIVGGVVVTYRDTDKKLGPIELFITTAELNSIAQKIKMISMTGNITEIAYARTSYKLSDELHAKHPEAKDLLSDGHAYDISTNVFDSLDFIFFDTLPDDTNEYLQIYGKQSNKRVFKWIKANFIENHPNLYKYKVLVPKSNGSIMFGDEPARMIGTPIVVPPRVGHTETFMSFGAFDTEQEAISTAKYIKTKFLRALLGILKVTQDNPVSTWTYIPLQDFTPNSDIDWTVAVSEIDRQLYKKYNLDDTEIRFIESHIKEIE